MVEEWDIRKDGITITGVKKKDSYRTAKCPQCGRFMEILRSGMEERDEILWHCMNPKCEHGKKNV